MILLAFSVFSFNKIQDTSLSKIICDKLLNAISLAKNEAITRQTETLICQSNNQQTCSGEWRDGFIVRAENKVIFSFLNKQNHHILHWRAFPNYLSDLEFFSSGLPKFQNGTFWFCFKGETQPEWAIVMSQTGRVRIIKDKELLEDDTKRLVC